MGKTLESIALVMLNPGIGRNPSVSRYDPIGVIDVKEVKVGSLSVILSCVFVNYIS